MKNIIVLLVFLISQTSFAQEKTLFGSGTKSTGTFGAAVVKYTSLNNQGSILVGARGGWIIDHSLILGGGMYGLLSDVPVDVIDDDIIRKNADNLHLRYGGFEIGYMFTPMEVFHLSLNALIGVGKVSYSNYVQTHYDNYYNNHHAGDSFFVLEPAVSLMANITAFFRFDVGVSYRFTSGADYQTIKDNTVSGLSGFIVLRFGDF